jgi:Glucodextranase, domain B
MSTQSIKASAPPSGVMRRYRSIRTDAKIPPPMAAFMVGGCLLLGLLTLTLSSRLMTDILGQSGAAFGNAVSQLASQAPATPPPSGVALDTPLLDAPPNNGYTNQPSMPLRGSVPGAWVGKTGYTVDVYALDKNGSPRQVASVAVGGTTRFMTPPMTLAEGSNAFVGKLSTPAGEGGPSPVVTYILDTAPPNIVISSPAPGTKVTTSSVAVSGTCDVGSTVSIRNERVLSGAFTSQVVGADGKFNLTVPVVGGPNTIDLSATDQAGNSSSTSLTVNRNYG